MKFHFPLEGLLRVRCLLEEQARERLEQCLMRIGSLERRLAEAQQWSLQTARICSSEKNLPAIEMQFVNGILSQTQEAMTRCYRQKQEEEERAGQLRAIYLLARRERKTVSTLRENALRQHQMEQARRQQAEMDDLFLGKLVYSRIAAPQERSEALPEGIP